MCYVQNSAYICHTVGMIYSFKKFEIWTSLVAVFVMFRFKLADGLFFVIDQLNVLSLRCISQPCGIFSLLSTFSVIQCLIWNYELIRYRWNIYSKVLSSTTALLRENLKNNTPKQQHSTWKNKNNKITHHSKQKHNKHEHTTLHLHNRTNWHCHDR